MRIVDSALYTRNLLNVGRHREQVDRLTQQISSGRRFSRPSEDPLGAERVLGLDHALEAIQGYTTNIERGQLLLQQSESALSHASNLMTRVREIAVLGADGTTTAEARNVMAAEVAEIREQLLNQANTNVDGVYVFGGLRNTTPPFSAGGAFSGDSGAFTVETNHGLRQQVNVDGARIFTAAGGVDVFQVLDDLRNDLVSNDGAAVATRLSGVDQAIDQVGQGWSEVGVRMNQLELAQNVLQDVKLARSEERSEVADTDAVAAITSLSQSQQALDAALRVTAMVDKQSLLDYL